MIKPPRHKSTCLPNFELLLTIATEYCDRSVDALIVTIMSNIYRLLRSP